MAEEPEMRKSLLATLAALGATLMAPISAHAASVAVVGPNVTVRPTQTSWTGSTSSATLDAAKNEFESFQVIVKSDGVATNTVNMAMQSTLTGPGGATIADSNVTIYREAYYDTSSVNAYLSDQDSPGAGEYPDALIPKVDPWYGETRNGFPVNIAAGRNIVGWIDVFVPSTQTAGTYTGTLRVTTSAGTLADVPISVTVANWAMPSTTRIGGGMDLNANQLCLSTTHGTGCSHFTGGQREAQGLYARVALDNRISIVKPGGAAAPGNTPFNTYTAPLLTGSSSPGVSSRLSGAEVNSVFVFPWDASNAGNWKSQGNTHGFLDRISFYCDELGQNTSSWNSCQSDYNTANGYWTATAPSNGNMPLSITMSIETYNWGKANGYSTFASKITTLIPLVTRAGIHETYPSVQSFPGKRNTTTGGADNDYPDWVSGGKQLWWYHSCMSMGCSPSATDTASWSAGSPSVGIDQPGMFARALSWNSYTYDISGEYYYEMAKQLNTAWTSQWNGDGGNHGDGTLFYPGCPSGCGGGPSIGGTKDIPIESIRIKRIRDSHEDYEYLKKAEDLGYGTNATTIARNLFDNVVQVDKTQAQLDSARASLIALLPAASAPTCNGLTATIYGVSGTINGTAGDDVIVGSSGSDTINPGGGNDTICAGDGYDYIYGSAGNDWIDGGAGGNGLDYAFSTGAVTINVGAGTVTGSGSDTVTNFGEYYGSPYNDTITGSSGADYLNGMGGNDTVNGAGGNDNVLGYDGNDTLEGGAGNDTITGGNGTDTVSFSTAASGVTASLASNTATGDGSDTFASVENLTGSAQRDILTGDTNANVITGLDGDDDLIGGDGNDTLTAGDGNDTLIGQGGDDTMSGDAGIDLVDYSGNGAGISGNLTGTMTGAGTDTLSGIEDVIGTSYRDVIVGNTAGNYMEGGDGDDDLFGGDGADNIQAGDGNDTLEGQAGNDTLNGGNGTDYLQYTSAPSAVTVNLGTGASSGGAGADALSNVEDVEGSAYNDTITGNGNNNYIHGGAGADTIDGGNGTDYLSGGDGNDLITSRDTNAETVTCGNNTDTVEADFLDSVNGNCETVNRA